MKYNPNDKLILRDADKTSRTYGMFLLGIFVRESLNQKQFIAIVEKFNSFYPIGTGYESIWAYSEIIGLYKNLTALEKIIYEA
jgi:hypothetical protein